MPRILIIGATGVFGSRLVTGLLQTTLFHVILAGRDPATLHATAQSLAATFGASRIATLPMDARSVTAATLRASGAFAIVDAAGPFQGSDHHLARTAIEAGLHIIDLADARDYVAGFGVLDQAAKQAGVVALTGASSTPALSHAVLDHLTQGWQRVDRVEIAISPGNRAPRGLSVIRAILSYAGRPVRVLDGGTWRTRPGWGMLVRRVVPGLGPRFLSLSETPDLDLVPARFGVTETAIFRAGLELSWLHLGLWAASQLVRLGLLRSLAPLAQVARALARLAMPFGTDRGGMLVEATGLDATGQPAKASWWLVAEAGDGPFVPTLPAIAALRALADGRLQPGAGACVGTLPLAAIEAEYAGHRIASFTALARPPPSLFETVLGEAFAHLPAPVRRLHQPGFGLRAKGTAQVEGATTRLARLTAAMIGFPRGGAQIPVTVDIVPAPGRETWRRDFGGKRFASTLSPSPRPGGIVERFGPLAFDLDLRTDDTGVTGMPIRSWRIGPCPLPRALAPIASASEGVDAQGRFTFQVDLHLPFKLGRIVQYRGVLVPAG